MKKNTVLTVLAGMVCLTNVANADFGFVPRASYAISNYSFSQDARPNVLNPDLTGGVSEFPEVNFDVTFNILGVGGTFYKDQYYLDLFASHSDNQTDEFELGGVFQETFKGDRQDYAITFGVKLLDDRASVYGGYKVGISDASGNQGTDLRFTEDGYFVGANYSWGFGHGTLTVNFAYALLDGELRETAAPTAQAFSAIPSLDLDADSEATGISYGVAWSAPLTDRWSYSLSVDANNYTFEDVRDNNAVNPPDEFEEEFVSARISFSYNF